MEFAPANLNIAKLKRKVDISNLTLRIAGENVFRKGRFYMLWKNGHFIVIQAEPWWRPDCIPDNTPPANLSHFAEELRALWYLQEVIQTMLDTILFDGENNWAHLVRLKDNSYRLVYKKRRLIQNCQIWTKVVELDDIEVTRFVSGLCWEGIYQGKDVDILIGWQDNWAEYISAESRGQKLVQSMGIGHYFFDLQAHVSQNGTIAGIMMEPIVGRCVTHADRSAVFEAVADIQRHGILFSFQIHDIHITEQGVRFASASSAEYYRDCDALAEEAKFQWKVLSEAFDHLDDNPGGDLLNGSRSESSSSALIMPRLPSPSHPITLTPGEAVVRWAWSIMTSDEHCRSQSPPPIRSQKQCRSDSYRHSATRRDKRGKGDNRALLPPDDFSDNLEIPTSKIESLDEPLSVTRGPVARWHPYARPMSKRLLLPQETDLALVGT